MASRNTPEVIEVPDRIDKPFPHTAWREVKKGDEEYPDAVQFYLFVNGLSEGDAGYGGST